MNKKIIFIIVLIAITGFMGIHRFGLRGNDSEKSESVVGKDIAEPEITIPDFQAPEDWLTYVDADSGFSFRYPSDFIITTSQKNNPKQIIVKKNNYYIYIQVELANNNGFGVDSVNEIELANENLYKKFRFNEIVLYRQRFEFESDINKFGPSTKVNLFTLNVTDSIIDDGLLPINLSFNIGNYDYTCFFAFDNQNIDFQLIEHFDNIISTFNWPN